MRDHDHNSNYGLVALKKRWVPEWLYSLASVDLPLLGQPVLRWPIRNLLTTPVGRYDFQSRRSWWPWRR